MKDINLYVTHNSNNELEEENGFFLTKLWNSLKRKSIKSRNKKKLQSNYNTNSMLQNSDNESDKTDNEQKLKYKHSIGRKTNSVISNNSDKSNNSNKSNNSDKKLYNKRDNSLDIIRNTNEEYEIVLPYQRFIK